ncbi:MAG: magnesium transporter MgtE [Rhodothermaceae bacterium]|nr:MAG: magnesium transporter MgtE [Rhodothermaceae bacterium]
MTQDGIIEKQGARPAEIELDQELVDNIRSLLEAGQRGMVLNIVADLHPADLASLMEHLSFDEARQLFQWLPVEQAGEVLAELDDDYRAELLEAESLQRLTAMLGELDTDDAADVLADLPEEVARTVLPHLEDAADLQELLTYEEDSAGGLMAREFVAVPVSWTVAEAIEELRRHADVVEDVYSVFAVDEQGHLQGTVSLKQLLLADPDARIGDIMDTDVDYVTADVDQEEVARLMERYDLVSLPVVDEQGRLIGRITIDDVVDVIREEAEEDIQRMSGVAGGEEPTDSVLRIVQGRLPWILAGMVGSGVAAFVIGYFSGALAVVPVLASFIPIVMATAGNAGIQSSAIAVQGLASGDVWASDILRRMLKELLVGLLNGFTAALIMGVFILIAGHLYPDKITDPVRLALTSGAALMIVIVLATVIGATIPLLLNRIGIDPAIATGPFITGSNDILGTLIFFWLATHFYLS